LVRLGARATPIAGALFVLLHSYAAAVPATTFGALAPLWTWLFGLGPLFATPRVMLFQGYPVIPWLGIMALGYGLAPVLRWPAERRRAALVRLGAGCVAAFIVVRALNVWRDRRPWHGQGSALMTVL